ncbi:probable G-protein coupled receptor 34 isoform X2 [Ambystoma mexicanum]
MENTTALRPPQTVLLPSSPTGNTTTCEIQDGFLAVALPVMYSLIFSVSLVTNSLALWVFQWSPQRKSSTSVYMWNLAWSDLLFTLCLPLRVAYQNQPGPFVLCRLVGAFFYLNMYASILFLSLISLDRYLKIIRPLRQSRMHSLRWSKMASALVWLSNLTCMMPFFLEARKAEPCSEKCFHFHSKGLIGATINIIVVVAFFILSALFVCSYGKISERLCRVLPARAQHQGRSTDTRALTKTLVVLVIFILCFVPYHLVRVPYVLAQLDVIASLSWKQSLHVTNETVLCISALNSCLDPIIYFFLSSSFRKAVLCTMEGKFKALFLMDSWTQTSRNRSVTDL